MNVLNVEAVDAFCDALAVRAREADDAATWLRSNLRNHVLRTPAFHGRVVGEAGLAAWVARGVVDEVPDWLAGALARGDDVVAFDVSRRETCDLADACGRVLDWLVARDRGVDANGLRKTPFADAVAASDAWHDAKAAERVRKFAKRRRITIKAATAILAADDPGVADLWPDDPTGVEEVGALEGGRFRVVRLLSPDALEREGTLLDHCVATYAEAVATGRSEILSLRDARNLPLVTMETAPFALSSSRDAFLAPFLPRGFRVLQQAFGRRNSPVPEGLRGCLAAFAEGEGIGVPARWAATLGKEGGYARHLDYGRLADGMAAIASRDPTPPWVRPGPMAARVARLLSASPDAIGQERKSAALRLFLPSAERVHSVTETHAALGHRLERTRISVPTGAFTPVASFLLDADPGAAHAACVAAAREVLDRMASGTGAAQAVGFTAPGTFPSTEAFFAYAGLLAEWTATRDAAASACRNRVGNAVTALRAGLRGDRMAPADRDLALNALNVTVPAIMASLGAVTTRERPSARPGPGPGQTLRRLFASAGREAPAP